MSDDYDFFEPKKQEIVNKVVKVTEEVLPKREPKETTPRLSRREVEDLVAGEIDKLRGEVNVSREALLILLAQCRTLAQWKAGKLRPWQEEFRRNINAAEEALGRPVTKWPEVSPKTPKGGRTP